jgi:hypothetical protein
MTDAVQSTYLKSPMSVCIFYTRSRTQLDNQITADIVNVRKMWIISYSVSTMTPPKVSVGLNIYEKRKIENYFFLFQRMLLVIMHIYKFCIIAKQYLPPSIAVTLLAPKLKTHHFRSR